MTTTRLVVGIIALLVAVFAGGCGLIVVAAGTSDLMAGRSDYGATFLGFLIGVVPGAIGALVAWSMFRKKPNLP